MKINHVSLSALTRSCYFDGFLLALCRDLLWAAWINMCNGYNSILPLNKDSFWRWLIWRLTETCSVKGCAPLIMDFLEFVLLALVQSRKSTPCSPQTFYLFVSKSCCRIRHLGWLGLWLRLWDGVNKSALTMLALQTGKLRVSTLCFLAQVVLGVDLWEPAWTWRQQLRAVYHKCPCFPTNSFLP